MADPADPAPGPSVAARLDATPVDLNVALPEALRDGNPGRRWRDGKPFAAKGQER